jgi:hypothetical protein
MSLVLLVKIDKKMNQEYIERERESKHVDSGNWRE